MSIDFSKIKVKSPSKLKFGSAGIPLSTPNPKSTLAGLQHLSKIGLEAMELEFVHSVNLNENTAPPVNEFREKNDISLTCHGSYYINLNATDPAKQGASRSRVLQAAKFARLAGAWSMTFHAAFFLKMEKSVVFDNVREQFKKIMGELDDQGNHIWVRPETTGKPVQFSGLRDLLDLSQEFDRVLPCVDFAHMHARTNGLNNTTEEFNDMLSLIEDKAGKEGLNNMHIHMSGIDYGEKGEKKHLPLDESDFNYKDLIKVWKDFKIKGVVISESPNVEDDGLLMKNFYESL